MSEHTPPPKTVELWIRSFAPASAGQTQERALERLDDLESNVPVESIEVCVWGKEVEQTEHARRIPQLQRIETRLEEFESWAARNGRRLEPFFRNTRIESTITGESHDVWRLPTVALAEFDGDGNVRHVAPCRDGEETTEVLERMETLVDGSESTAAVGDDGRGNEVMANRTSYGLGSVEPSFSGSD